MHSGRSCQLHKTAGVPDVARGHSGRPESKRTVTLFTLKHVLLVFVGLEKTGKGNDL